jgi:uroporphyrinogen-III synthase
MSGLQDRGVDRHNLENTELCFNRGVKRVLVTRAANQASALAEGLRALGIEPIVVPAIEIVPPASFEKVDATLGRLARFDWVVFTSANAVEYFHQRWQTVRRGLGIGLAEELSVVRVAAVGMSTAKVLGTLGIKVDLVPAKAEAESLAGALVPFARRPDGGAVRFLMPRAEAARDVLPVALREAGADVEDVTVYRNVVPKESIAAVEALFGDGGTGVDAVTFTSGSTVTNLLALLEVAGVTLPEDVLKISIGPVTSRVLREAGLPPDGEAAQATLASLVEKVGELVLHNK